MTPPPPPSLLRGVLRCNFLLHPHLASLPPVPTFRRNYTVSPPFFKSLPSRLRHELLAPPQTNFSNLAALLWAISVEEISFCLQKLFLTPLETFSPAICADPLARSTLFWPQTPIAVVFPFPIILS